MARMSRFRDNFAAYVMPLAAGAAGDRRGQGRIGDAGRESQRRRRDLSVVDGWRASSSTGALGRRCIRRALDAMMPLAPPKDDEKPSYKPPETGVDLSIPVTAAKPTGTLVLTGARIVTMADDQWRRDRGRRRS